MTRCDWVKSNQQIHIDYHDLEWGVPVYSDQKFFEMLLLESFQSGLSWLTILKKREAFSEAFSKFDYRVIKDYSDDDINKLCANSSIVRNRRKIRSVVNNAARFYELIEEHGSFSDYFWGFTDGKILQPCFRSSVGIPTKSLLSEKIAKDLKQKGFQFLGPVVIQSHIYACGMINAHTTNCYRHLELFA